MFKIFTMKNSEYSKLERGFTSLFSFITFGFVGAVVRLFLGPITLGNGGELLSQFGPCVFGFGATAAILGYYFPKALNILMCFIPIPGASS